MPASLVRSLRLDEEDVRLWLKVVLNAVVIGASAFVAWRTFSWFNDALTVAYRERNLFLNYDGFMWFAAAVCMAAFAVGTIIAWNNMDESEYALFNEWLYAPSRLIESASRGVIVSAVASIALFCLIPVPFAVFTGMTPYRLSTPDGYVRVMDDGRVLRAGETIVSDRSKVRSVAVAIRQEAEHRIALNFGAGHSVLVVFNAEHELATESARFRDLVAGNTPKLGLGLPVTNSSSVPEPQQEAQGAFFGREANVFLIPMITQVVREAEAGTLPRGNMSLRLGTLVRDDAAGLPPWERSLTVTYFDVPEWTQKD